MDTAAALDRYSREQIIGFARRLDPGLTNRDFAEAAGRLDQWGDGATFARETVDQGRPELVRLE